MSKWQKHIEYNKSHRKQISEWERRYRRTGPGLFAHVKKIARRRSQEFLLTKEWFVRWFIKQPLTCGYCERSLSYNREIGTSPSIDRKNNQRGYVVGNICLCCELCNRVKNKYFTFKQMKIIGQTIKQIYANAN